MSFRICAYTGAGQGPWTPTQTLTLITPGEWQLLSKLQIKVQEHNVLCPCATWVDRLLKIPFLNKHLIAFAALSYKFNIYNIIICLVVFFLLKVWLLMQCLVFFTSAEMEEIRGEQMTVLVSKLWYALHWTLARYDTVAAKVISQCFWMCHWVPPSVWQFLPVSQNKRKEQKEEKRWSQRDRKREEGCGVKRGERHHKYL